MNEAPTNRLRELRAQRELSRAAVAVQVGVGEQQVRRWEDNELLVPTKHLPALTGLFEVSVEHLMGWDRVPSTEVAS
jgi:transcriptional regulator with XRE-family HTH domain